MRPHLLRLTAFGPFADTVEVDFDRLGQGGLFLMHGETGAGKTTVLDGLSFALYGRVPGVRGVNRLRSDHAAAGTHTEVRLDLSLGGRRFLIVRSPAQERRKQRGTGVTSDPASVSLFERDETVAGGWLPRSQRVGEVDAELSDLLGMSAEQFHQVVLLPQGQFAKFLHSDAGERTALLQRLFGTDRFRKIEDWLADQRRQTKDAFVEAHHGVRRLVARIAQVCGEPEPEELPEPSWVADQLARARRVASEAASGATGAAAEAQRAQVAAVGAQDLARRQQRLRAGLARKQAVEEAADAMARLGEEIDRARRANGVASSLEAQASRAKRAAHAQAGLKAAHEALPSALRSASVNQLREAGVAGRETLGRLSEAVQLEESLQAAEQEVAAAEQSIGAARRRALQLAPLAEQAPLLQAAAQRRVVVAREAAVALPTAKGTADRAAEALATAKLLAARTTDIERLGHDHLAAREKAADLREALNDLRNDRIDGMIAELASALMDRAPCPVCGALDHPDPSEVRGRQVSRADEEKAAAAADAARDRVATVAEQLAGAQAALEAAGDRLRALGQDEADLAVLTSALTSALAFGQAEVRRLTAVAGDLVAAESDVAALAVAEVDRINETSGLAAAITTGEQASRAATARATQLAERLSVLLNGAVSVAAARQDTQRFVETLEAAEAAGSAAAQAETERLAADRSAEQAATTAGFVGVDEARAALRSAAGLRVMEAQRLGAREEAAAVAELLSDPQLAVEMSPPAPVEATQVAAHEAAAMSRQAEQRLARITERVDQLVLLEAELADQLLRLQPIELAARNAKELADVAGGIGANRLNMTLSAYVLAARLEEVAEVASLRLRAMTQGRYTLIHSDVTKGNARSGLRLLVSDAWTGQDRDTATLSGGETFLASLALALGLAEVVTASAGGAPLEALFIDEGFGTLDSETLDEVLDVLDGLREGGRLVGIVSHVPHLRERIPSQLRVHKGTSGSTLRQSDDPEPADRAAPADAMAMVAPAALIEPESKPIEPVAPTVIQPVIHPVSEQLALLS